MTVAIKYNFDRSFQTKIAALVTRDSIFNERVEGLIQPEYFEDLSEAILVGIVQDYYTKYHIVPDGVILAKLVKEAIIKKVIRPDMKDDVVKKLMSLRKEAIHDRDYVIDETSAFAKHQAIERAVLKTVDLMPKRDFESIEKLMQSAFQVGTNEAVEYDLFGETESRANHRLEVLAGNISPRGVTTGNPTLDKLLYHEGWGRAELTALMGGAKVGKSTGLISFGINAMLAGNNVLYVTLEMSKEIAAERAEANLADMVITDMKMHPHEVKKRMDEYVAKGGMGLFKIHEYPSGTFKPRDMNRLITHYKALGIAFDLVVVDYLDIMAPNMMMHDTIANSKSIWVDMRAIAQIEDFALLSATQTNREGYKASVAKADQVAEDFNKIRIADLTISINKTEDEERLGEARLFFAASRNQKGNLSIHIKQELEKMKFMTSILSVD